MWYFDGAHRNLTMVDIRSDKRWVVNINGVPGFGNDAIIAKIASITIKGQVTGLPGNETATLGATARGDNASVSLRGIPSSNTLILLNGRRLAPHPISQAEFDAIFGDLAKQYGAAIYPFFLEEIYQEPELFQGDPFHYTGDFASRFESVRNATAAGSRATARPTSRSAYVIISMTKPTAKTSAGSSPARFARMSSHRGACATASSSRASHST